MIVEIKAKRAMFCDPVFKTERRTYPVPTPSAIAGALRSVYKKPEMYYVIDKIRVMREPVVESCFLRFVEGKASDRTTTDEGPSMPRTQGMITNPHYFVEFHICLTGRGDPARDSLRKHYEILERRLLKGQYFTPPYLGTKECHCTLTLVGDASDVPESEMKGEYPLPTMVYDVPIDPATSLPGDKTVLYHPRCVDGTIDCAEGLARSFSEGGLLLSLERFYRRHGEEKDMPRQGYESVGVSWRFLISEAGEPLAFLPASDEDERGQVVRMTLPAAPFRSGKKLAAAFGWGACDYVLGLDEDEARGREKLNLFRRMLREVVGDDCPAMLPLYGFYDVLDKDPERILSMVGPHADPGSGAVTLMGNVVFEVSGRGHLLEESEILDAWNRRVLEKSLEGPRGTCFVTGEENVTLADQHARVKGVYGAGSLCRLISIDGNTPSLFSYGREGLANAPVGRDVSFRAHTALNWLLANQSGRTSKGTLVYWSEDALPSLTEKLRSLFNHRLPDPGAEVPDGAAFHLAELRGNGAGRVYVAAYERFCYGDGRLLPFLERLGGVSFDAMKLCNWKGEDTMDKTTSAYLLGELFAEVRVAQIDAVPSTLANGGIERTMMNGLASRPNVGTARLMRAMRIYLQKRDYGIGGRIAATLRALEALDDPYPKTFSPSERCTFGHAYHVTLERLLKERAERIEAAVSRKGGAADHGEGNKSDDNEK